MLGLETRQVVEEYVKANLVKDGHSLNILLNYKVLTDKEYALLYLSYNEKNDVNGICNHHRIEVQLLDYITWAIQFFVSNNLPTQTIKLQPFTAEYTTQ
jgi:hypothetical protein